MRHESDPGRDAWRVERDLLGERRVPLEAYWGIHTLRALENFPIGGPRLADAGELVEALAAVKQAAALANRELGLLDAARAGAIVSACEEIRAGALRDQFPVALVQGGAGTSTNMNANEVIANRALEQLGLARGDYGRLHPNEHVNLSQSTNDVYPTAVRLALAGRAQRLTPAIAALAEAFGDKAREFAGFVKIGRTQLQAAVPMTLGQELGGVRETLLEDVDRLAEAVALLSEINLGATAVGTGLNAPDGYAALACRHLSRLAGRWLSTAPNLVEATQDTGALVQLSGVLKRLATKLSKICNDLRLLSSGPPGGFAELRLPAVQAGSSMMPGKVNPVVPELVNQIGFEVIGNDLTVTMAAQGGQLQLNAFEPIIFKALWESLRHLEAGIATLTERCVRGIEADREALLENTGAASAVATALSPLIGYAAASGLAREAQETGRGVAELALEHELLSGEQLVAALEPLAPRDGGGLRPARPRAR